MAGAVVRQGRWAEDRVPQFLVLQTRPRILPAQALGTPATHKAKPPMDSVQVLL
ncbi:unnamed protein product [Lepidochelys olivacea]